MEEILKSKSLKQPLGIRCMELCIKEVDETTKEFLRKYHNLVDLSSAPSWKFPHLNMSKLDIHSVMERYHLKKLSEDRHYPELLELLIDRICFFLYTTNQLMSSSDICRAEYSLAQHGQGDCLVPVSHRKEDSGAKTINEGHFHNPNVGVLLSELYTKVSLLIDIKLQSKKNKDAKKPKYFSTCSQTDTTTGSCCESCFVAQYVLKFLATAVTDCLCTFSRSNSNDQDSLVSETEKFREDLTTSVWNLSQRSVVLKWCNAVHQDTKSLIDKATTLLTEKAALEQRVADLKSVLATEEKKQLTITKGFQRRLKAYEDEVQNEKKQNRKLSKQNEFLTSKYNELEAQLKKKVEECGSAETKLKSVEESLKKLMNTYQSLKVTHTTTEQSLGEVQTTLKSVKDANSALERRVSGLGAQLELKDEEILKLNHTLEKARSDEMYKEEMRDLLEQARKQLESCKKVEKEHKKTRIGDRSKIKELKEEVENQCNQIELLTLYPDLNGPINPPTQDDENPLEAMEKQVKSNKLRIEVLQCQTERLELTLTKLRSHLSIN